MTTKTSISEAQLRRAIHGVVMKLASIDPDSENYGTKLAELASHLERASDPALRAKPQPRPGQTGSAAYWRGQWTRQKGRIAQAAGTLLSALRQAASRLTKPRAAALPLRHADSAAATDAGRFIEGNLAEGQSGAQRTYMLYVPANQGRTPAPLLVLLHGCKQSVADFAAGTRMNEAAEAAGVVVLYPEQSLAANLLRCWNWYALHDRSNKSGDAAVIVAMTRQVMREHEIDATRVYVAGMSAGGGMAAVLVRDYPELYAALGVHSGVPAGHAHDAYSAMRLMSAGPLPYEDNAARGSVAGIGNGVASIVFHGDEDNVVHLSNGVAIHAGAGGSQGSTPLDPQQATTLPRPGHRGFTRSIEYGRSGVTDRELWIVHGAGHAWAGGSGTQEHTDSSGPDASSEMLRFFLQHRLAT